MKKLFLLAVICLFAAGCSNESDSLEFVENNRSQEMATVNVHLGGFKTSVEEISQSPTRAVQSVKDYTKVKHITLAFYDSNNAEQAKVVQMRDNLAEGTTFGEFSCQLPVGTYTMVVVASAWYDGDAFELTSPTVAAFTGGKARETFAATKSVTVNGTSTLEETVTLNRIVSKLDIWSTENIPSDIDNMRVTFGGGSRAFNPTTSVAADNNGVNLTVEITENLKNKICHLTSFVFLTEDPQSMVITIEALDGDNQVKFRRVVENVPFKRNRGTKLTGELFTARPSSFTMSIEDSWLEEYAMDF